MECKNYKEVYTQGREHYSSVLYRLVFVSVYVASAPTYFNVCRGGRDCRSFPDIRFSLHYVLYAGISDDFCARGLLLWLGTPRPTRTAQKDGYRLFWTIKNVKRGAWCFAAVLLPAADGLREVSHATSVAQDGR